jgi:hypothetical protein
LTFLTTSDAEAIKSLSTKNAKELCHVHILSVEPHFSAEELSERLTPFEKHTNIGNSQRRKYQEEFSKFHKQIILFCFNLFFLNMVSIFVTGYWYFYSKIQS